MISFRAVDGTTFVDPEAAIHYETRRLASSDARVRRGVGSSDINRRIRENLQELKRWRRGCRPCN